MFILGTEYPTSTRHHVATPPKGLMTCLTHHEPWYVFISYLLFHLFDVSPNDSLYVVRPSVCLFIYFFIKSFIFYIDSNKYLLTNKRFWDASGLKTLHLDLDDVNRRLGHWYTLFLFNFLLVC
jgi:hypothetical protein